MKIVAFAAIAVTIAILATIFILPEGVNGPKVPIRSEFPEKIVYEYLNDDSVTLEDLQNDCRIRGGRFNECGSLCRDGEICIKVCALTCELKKESSY